MHRTIISIIDDLWLLNGNSIGRRLVLTSFGESHGKCIGAVLDGCPAGLELEENDIQKMLDLRKPGQSLVSTQRKEGDVVEILTGTFRGYTTGAPITMIIWNKDQKSIAYEKAFWHSFNEYFPQSTPPNCSVPNISLIYF